jgi:hypothetical protein
MTVWTLPRGEPMHLAGLAAICCAIPIPIRLHASCPDNFLRLCPDNCRLGGGGCLPPAAGSFSSWRIDQGSIWQLPIDRGMIIGLLLQPFFQELKPVTYLTNDDSALCCAAASSYRPRDGWASSCFKLRIGNVSTTAGVENR